MTFLDMLFILSIRFFLFEFYLFERFRIYLKDLNWFFNKLLKCSFCQGFWTGSFYYLFYYNCSLDFIRFGFASAILSYTWIVLLFRLSEDMENSKK